MILSEQRLILQTGLSQINMHTHTHIYIHEGCVCVGGGVAEAVY